MKYFEDMTVGETFRAGPITVTRDEIVSFARQFDPQLFHLDEAAAARSIFGGLVASGWHTTALCQRLLVAGVVTSAGTASLGSPGVDELRWIRPVRPGDSLTLEGEVIALEPSRSKPDRGSARIRYQLTNQAGDVVLRMIGIGMIARRPRQ